MTPYQNGNGAASALAPEAPLFTDNDPALFGEALAAAALAATKHPLTGASLTMQLATSGSPIRRGRTTRGSGRLRQAYLALPQYGLDLVNVSDLDEVDRARRSWR